MDARYLDPDRRAVEVTLPAGETLGTMAGPATFRPGMAEGNAEHDALMGLVAAGAVEIAAYVPPPPAVPETISDRQFAQALAMAGTITQDEALAWAARGDLPEAMTDALAQVPEAGGQRFGARMMLAAATTYARRHPLTDRLGGLLGYDAAALDALWTRAAAL